jgi:hypothetical protein
VWDLHSVPAHVKQNLPELVEDASAGVPDVA